MGQMNGARVHELVLHQSLINFETFQLKIGINNNFSVDAIFMRPFEWVVARVANIQWLWANVV